MRVVQISDIHLSPTHGFFVENLWKTIDYVGSLKPDFIIVTGDLAINGPDDERELAFAQAELQRLPAPWLAIPGNHDVGDEPPGQDVKQLIDQVRLDRWRAHVGADCWTKDLGDWRFIALNAQLFGSGLDADNKQRQWLEGELRSAGAKNLGVFLHKPLFALSTSDPASTSCITPEPRQYLIALLRDAGVRFVASGHLHCHKQTMHEGMDLIWAPSTAFINGSATGAVPDHIAGTRLELGILVFDFDGGDYKVAFDCPTGLKQYYLHDIKQGKYAFLRDMPPYFPQRQA